MSPMLGSVRAGGLVSQMVLWYPENIHSCYENEIFRLKTKTYPVLTLPRMVAPDPYPVVLVLGFCGHNNMPEQEL